MKLLLDANLSWRIILTPIKHGGDKAKQHK